MSEKREPSRAEAVRARRAQRSAKELAQTTQRAVKPISTVSTRGEVSYVADKRKRAENTRRRFNVALGLPHITLHKPTFQFSRPVGNWRLISIITSLDTLCHFKRHCPISFFFVG